TGQNAKAWQRPPRGAWRKGKARPTWTQKGGVRGAPDARRAWLLHRFWITKARICLSLAVKVGLERLPAPPPPRCIWQDIHLIPLFSWFPQTRLIHSPIA